jgi:hypothetical protein
MKLGNRPIGTPLGLIAAALVVAMMFVVGGVAATTATGAGQEVSAASNVAKNAAGKMKSTITGKTSDGGKLGGTFTPVKFKAKQGVTQVKGIVDGVITHADGSKSKFTAIRSLEVRKINGQKLSNLAVSAQAASACDILNLVLGPLDLNVLGLEVHLNQVVLDIIATPGPGQLLGNLLCAVAGLLDGGPLAGLLGQLVSVLNQILDRLGLGV